MSNARAADLIFVCAEIMEIMARADALRIVLVGDPKGGAVKAEIAALEKASDELLERMDGMPSLSQQRRPATKVNRRLDL